MQTTLAERLRKAMDGPPKRTGSALAKACNIKPPSVSDWLTGKSRSMDGSNLIDAAEFLGVDAKWLIKGVGLMRNNNPPDPAIRTGDTDLAQPYSAAPANPWLAEATQILSQLQPDDLRAAVLNLRTFVAQIGPPKPPRR